MNTNSADTFDNVPRHTEATLTTAEHDELVRLRAENARLRGENGKLYVEIANLRCSRAVTAMKEEI